MLYNVLVLGHKANRAACAVQYYHPEFGSIRSPVPTERVLLVPTVSERSSSVKICRTLKDLTLF